MAEEEQQQQVALRPIRKAVSPPTYFGRRNDSPQLHLDAFEIAAEANSWGDESKLASFPSTLGGYAMQWFITAAAQRRREELEEWTWPELKAEFLRDSTEGLYARGEEYQLMESTQREGESPLAYLMAIENLCNHVEWNMDDARRIIHFKRGLSDKWFEKVNTHAFNSVAQLKEILARLSETEERIALNRRRRGGNPDLELFVANAPATQSAEVEKKPKGLGEERKEIDNPNTSTREAK